MARMTEYISVGFCQSYGEGDHRISMEIQKLSRKELDDLILAAFHATRHAFDIWYQGQPREEAAAEIPSPIEPPST